MSKIDNLHVVLFGGKMSKIDKLHAELLRHGIVGSQGTTTFQLNNTTATILGTDSVGNLIQEWLKTFMENSNISYRVKPDTQKFPDFLMHDDDDDDTKELLEIKCFQGSAGFDVANFDAYIRSLLDHPYRLDARYLIFEYCKNDQGIQIKGIFLKNIWEITGPSERSTVKIQWKQDRPINIRPITWEATRSQFDPFTSRLAFVEALNTVIQSAEANVDANIKNNWIEKVSASYFSYTQQNL